MEILSVTLLVLSGVAISSVIERLWLGLRYDLIAVASLVVMFGSVVLALMVFQSLGLSGVLLTFFASVLLHPVYVKFNFQGNVTNGSDRSIWGCVYWAIFLIVFTIAGLKSWIISGYISSVFSLGNGILSFYVTLCVFVVAGCLSMLMTIREVHYCRDR